MLVVAAVLGCAGSPTVADVAGNAWTLDKYSDGATNGNGWTMTIFHAISKGTAPTLVSVTPAGTCFHGNVDDLEYSGVTTLDTATAVQVSSYSLPTATLTTAHSGELVLALGSLYSATGYANRQTFFGGILMEGTSTGTSTTYTDTSPSAIWAFVMVAFK